MPRPLIWTGLLLGTLAATAHAQQPLVYTHATLIDASAPAARAGWTLIINGERITDLFPDGKKPLPRGARVVDLAGTYVIPGLIDAHVHVATDPAGRDANAVGQLRGALRGGITSVRDMAGDAVVLRELARAASNPAAPSPSVYYSAVMAGPTFFEDPRTRTAAHGGAAGAVPWLRAVSDTTNVVAAVRAARATGATGLKLYADLPAQTVVALAAEGHKQGLEVWGHATVYPARPGDLVNAGANAISHAVLMYWQGAADVPAQYHSRASRAVYDSVAVTSDAVESLLREMKKRGTVLDATLFISSRLEVSPPGTAGMANPKRAVQWMYDVTRRANELGVFVAAGTDGMMPGSDTELPNIHREMELLVTRAGFTPWQAIAAATINSARAIGIHELTGTIAVGKMADLVVLRANPLLDIRNTREVYFVVKRGTEHGAAELAHASERPRR